MARLIAVCVLALCCAAVQAGEAKDGDLTVAGHFSVPAPGDGFAWKKVRESESANGKVQVFVAAKEGSAARVVLTVEPEPADTDAKKLARLKGDYNGLIASLRGGGYTELKGTPPSLGKPIPTRVSFSISGKDKAGKPAVFRSVDVFGKSTFHFQVATDSEDEAERLSKVAESVRE